MNVPQVSRIHVVTVCTNKSRGLENLLFTIQKQGYNQNGHQFHVIGSGEKWKGWPWRTKKYKEAINDILRNGDNEDTLFCLVDANDLFFIGPPERMITNFLKYNCKVVVSAERNSFVVPKDAKKFFKERNSTTVFKYPNHGCIIGYGKEIVEILEKNKESPDDQQGIQSKFASGEIQYEIDYKTSLVANIVFNLKDNVIFQIVEGKIQSTISGEYPVVAHFPGKDPIFYNMYLKELYPSLEPRSWQEYVKGFDKAIAIGFVVLLFFFIGLYIFSNYRNSKNRTREDFTM